MKGVPALERGFGSYYGTIPPAVEAMTWVEDATSLIAKTWVYQKHFRRGYPYFLKDYSMACRRRALSLQGSG